MIFANSAGGKVVFTRKRLQHRQCPRQQWFRSGVLSLSKIERCEIVEPDRDFRMTRQLIFHLDSQRFFEERFRLRKSFLILVNSREIIQPDRNFRMVS